MWQSRARAQHQMCCLWTLALSLSLPLFGCRFKAGRQGSVAHLILSLLPMPFSPSLRNAHKCTLLPAFLSTLPRKTAACTDALPTAAAAGPATQAAAASQPNNTCKTQLSGCSAAAADGMTLQTPTGRHGTASCANWGKSSCRNQLPPPAWRLDLIVTMRRCRTISALVCVRDRFARLREAAGAEWHGFEKCAEHRRQWRSG